MFTQTDPVANQELEQAPPRTGNDKIYRWGILPSSRLRNVGLRPLFLLVSVLAITIGFNKSSYAVRFYTWLNTRYTPTEVNFLWSFGITTVVYWVAGLWYMLVDLSGWPGWMAQYKLQPTKRVTGEDYKKVCRIVLRNQVLVVAPINFLLASIRPLPTGLPLPGAFTTILTYIFCLACEEIGFYYVHRALHSPSLYKRFHKKHHEYTAPVALAATYCTMVEHVTSNLFPIICGLYLLNSHVCLLWMFFCSLELGTLATHSGYNVNFSSSALVHDWHHFYFLENFGPTGLLDRFNGTDKTYTRWMNQLSKEFGPGSETRARELINKWEAEKEAKGAKLASR